VHKAINLAVDLLGLIPVYPVRNMKTFGGNKADGAFPECILLPRGTTVRQFAKLLHAEIDRNYLFAEAPDGRRLAEDEVITDETCIIRFVTSISDSDE